MFDPPHPRRTAGIALALVLTAISVAGAMPLLMDRYNAHPQMRPELRDRCVICHVYEDGSGPLTAFGKKYDRENLEFAAELIREYPNLFLVEGSTATEAGSPAADGSPAAAVAVPGNEPFDARKYYLSECKECHGKYGDGDPFQGVPAFATDAWFAERSPLTDKWISERSADTAGLVEIILHGKNKMIGQAGKITRDDAHDLVELIRLIAEKYS